MEGDITNKVSRKIVINYLGTPANAIQLECRTRLPYRTVTQVLRELVAEGIVIEEPSPNCVEPQYRLKEGEWEKV